MTELDLIGALQQLTQEQRERLARRIDQATPEQQRAMLVAARQAAWERCEQDGLYFLRFVRTRDEADPEQPLKPFPQRDYIRRLWDLLVTQRVVAIVKSRQMMASWLLCAFCCWWARFKPHQLVLWQTQKWEDALEKVALPGKGEGGFMGRCQFIERHLPEWLQIKQITTAEGRLDYPNGSRIQAVPGGADKIRGLTASLIVEDEFAFQPEARGVWTTVAPLIQKATKFVAVSTPNGIGNVFADLVFGRNTAEEGAGMMA